MMDDYLTDDELLPDNHWGRFEWFLICKATALTLIILAYAVCSLMGMSNDDLSPLVGTEPWTLARAGMILSLPLMLLVWAVGGVLGGALAAVVLSLAADLGLRLLDWRRSVLLRWASRWLRTNKSSP